MVRNKLSQLGAFLLLAVLLSVSACGRPSRRGTSGTAAGPTPTQSPGRTTPSPTPTPSPGVWTPIGPKGGIILALAIDPRTPTTLYAGIVKPTGFFEITAGVFKSTDGGANWQAIGLTNLEVLALAIDPQTPTTLYAGTRGGGVYKSTDGGASWQAIGLIGYTVHALAIDPQTPTTLYAGDRYRLLRGHRWGVPEHRRRGPTGGRSG